MSLVFLSPSPLATRYMAATAGAAAGITLALAGEMRCVRLVLLGLRAAGIRLALAVVGGAAAGITLALAGEIARCVRLILLGLSEKVRLGLEGLIGELIESSTPGE